MQVFTYSSPRFSPYGDEDRSEASDAPQPGGAWRAPRASRPLRARLSLPGSKSLTNRELVLAALADGTSVLKRPLISRDTELMIEALRSLGVTIERVEGEGAFGPDLRITPPDELSGSTTIDCGLAGTVMRFLPPVAALSLGPVAFDGDDAARRRPMRTTIESLRALGVDVNDDGRGSLPFSLWGSGAVQGGELSIDASSSSQFISGLLLAAPRFERGLVLRHTGERLPSLPHIAMTIETLRRRGVQVDNPEPGLWAVLPGPIAATETVIEPDLSNAAPFLVAALVAGGTIAIEGWPRSTTQVGADLEHLLPLFGARVHRDGSALVVDGGAGVCGGASVPGVDIDLSTGGELAPALVALATLASGPSTFRGIEHLRGHETDRLSALVAEITAIGGSARELEDGVSVTPSPLHGGPWRAYEDHRMATAGAIVGLAVDDVTIDDIGTTAKTLPQFPELWQRMLASSEGDSSP
ncbi:MAG: 3-phosphoshikimate 1-carboxyvinyltransferase [Microcella sp.]|uniref:3-phosphoshikimate 1-carboxyvinyltransferase n=1 Tax=Microcella sp. TaxID=1913979 RepID=UPI00331624B5